MNGSESLQLIGTLAIIAMGFLGLSVAFNLQRWCQYGRETLACIAVYLLVASVVRFLITPFELLTQEQGRIANGMVAVCFAVILAQIVYIHASIHRNGLKGKNGGTT